ncbi:MAG TPA: condensation domain-containing protein, partial [Thermoanaerobaculia bacterium]|nr:condensation domain-containing protein [Thermoanaerobaculia bacterium]
VGVEDDFFALGGHSLLATQVISRVRAGLGVELPLRALFEGPTVAALASRIEPLLGESGEVLPPLLARSHHGPLPLSFAQERLWFLDQLEPESAQYNIASALELKGPLRPAALAWVLGQVERRHEPLRTVFAAVADSPVQVIGPAREPFPLPMVDLLGLPAVAREAEVTALAGAEATRPFDLGRGPLWRATLLRSGAERYALLLTLHHIAADGWSIGVLVREVAELYGAAAAGRRAQLPELPIQYADYAIWQRGWLAGELLERQLAYWQRQLAGAPELLELPTDRPRPAVQTFAGASLAFALPAELADGLTVLSRSSGATLFMALLAAFQALLGRYSGQEDVVTGTPIAGRNHVLTERLIGFFVNSLAIRTRLLGDPELRELLARVRESTLSAFAHQDLPFEKLVGKLPLARNRSHAPLFQVAFVLQNAPSVALVIPELEFAPMGVGNGAAKFDLTATVVPDAGGMGGLMGSLEYNRDLFDRATIRRFIGHFQTLLAATVAEPRTRLAELPLLALAERHQLLAEWNNVVATADRDLAPALHDLFAAQVARTPEALAVTCEGAALTYAELDRRAGRLARRLRALGVGPEVRVALLLDRSLARVTATLGILQAGGCYLPLDPTYPKERLAFLLGDSAAAVVLTETALLATLPPTGVPVLCLDREERVPEPAEDGMAPLPEVGPEALAYVMYTSGSSGTPKGVAVPHRAVVRLVRGAGYAAFGPREVFLQLAPYAFDAATFELWGALLHGGRLVMPPPGSLS